VHFALFTWLMGVSWIVCQGWPQTMTLPISDFQEVRIIGVIQQCFIDTYMYEYWSFTSILYSCTWFLICKYRSDYIFSPWNYILGLYLSILSTFLNPSYYLICFLSFSSYHHLQIRVVLGDICLSVSRISQMLQSYKRLFLLVSSFFCLLGILDTNIYDLCAVVCWLHIAEFYLFDVEHQEMLKEFLLSISSLLPLTTLYIWKKHSFLHRCTSAYLGLLWALLSYT
jgi:hypothetical protein